jgi:alkanesulfonate monooxygenase SsuD/methylene tetrahydromethanopterin reductase-like flavin-dependent oxidoreductase (luciferase family)
VRFAISSPNIGSADDLVGLAVASEESGWDAFFLWDHMHLQRDLHLNVFDPWVVLGAAAQATERIRLGTLVTPVARRRPAKLAKEIVTLDHLSNGRVIFGVGLGFPGADEFAMFGDDARDRTRGERLDEGLAIIESCLTGDAVKFDGKHFRVDAEMHPGAWQRPRPPIWVAGMAPNRAPLRRAARYEGVVPISGDGMPLPPSQVNEYLASEPALAVARERNDFEIVMSWGPGFEPGAYRDAGATWLVDSTWPADDGMQDLRRRVAAGPPR